MKSASDLDDAEHSAAPQRAEWAQQPERSNQFWLRVMTAVSLRCGRRLSRSVLHVIATYFLLFSPRARRASTTYLQRALQRPPRWSDLYRQVFAFATMIHDRLYLLHDQLELFSIEIEGRELVDQYIERGEGVFLMGAHFGSFEVMRALAQRYVGLRVGMMMFEENARKIQATLAAINPEIVDDIIPLGRLDTMLQVQERLAAGGLVGILADRSLGKDAATELDFLGVPALFPLGPMRLAAVMKRPVIFMVGMYRGGNRYTIRFAPIADFTAVTREQRNAAVLAGMEKFRDRLEQSCRDAPYNWFNFFDFWGSAATKSNTSSPSS